MLGNPVPLFHLLMPSEMMHQIPLVLWKRMWIKLLKSKFHQFSNTSMYEYSNSSMLNLKSSFKSSFKYTSLYN